MAFRAMRESTDVTEPEMVNPRVWKMFREVRVSQGLPHSVSMQARLPSALQPSGLIRYVAPDIPSARIAHVSGQAMLVLSTW
jgi:hypothetical protein